MLFQSIYQRESPQRIRAKYIHHMVRDWFVENRLEMSFPDKRTREIETLKNREIRKKILSSPNTRLNEVKEKLRLLQEKEKQNPSKAELIRLNEDLIKACRVYMKKTRLPNDGDSLYRVNLAPGTRRGKTLRSGRRDPFSPDRSRKSGAGPRGSEQIQEEASLPSLKNANKMVR